jgi:hypothetical protein
MRTVAHFLVLGGLMAATAASAAPAMGSSGSGFYAGPVVTVGPALQKKWAIRNFIKEGKALQAADGGTLTPEHRAYLQAKWDAIRAGNY